MIDKSCSSCGEILPVEDFYLWKGKFSSRCKSCSRKKAREWAAKNPEKDLERKRQWARGRKRSRDPEKMRRYNQKWVKNNPEERKRAAREWAAKNPESGRRAEARRRAKKRGAVSCPYSELEVLDKYGTTCHICGHPIDLDASRKIGSEGWEMALQIDHLVPISAGGADTLENTRPSHGLCNLRKNGRLL